MTKKNAKHRRFETAGAFIVMAALMVVAGVSCMKRKHSSPVDPANPRIPTSVFTITASPTVTFTFTNSETPSQEVIDNFTDMDLVSLNSGGTIPWLGVTDGAGSSINPLSAAATSLSITGSLVNNMADGSDWIGWSGALVGEMLGTGTPITAVQTNKSYINFVLGGTGFVPDNAARYRGFRVRIQVADGDIYSHDISPFMAAGGPITIDMMNSVADAANTTTDYSLETLQDIVGLSFEAFVWDDSAAGAGSGTATYDLTIDDVEMQAGLTPGDLSPRPVNLFIDDFTDMDWVSTNGAWWAGSIDAGGASAITSYDVTSGAVSINGTLSNNEDDGGGDYQAWGSIEVGSASDPLIGITYAGTNIINFRMTGLDHASGATSSGHRMTITFDNGDSHRQDLNKCLINGWTGFSFDMNTMTPDGSNLIGGTASANPGNIIGFSVNVWIWDTMANGPGYATGVLGLALDDVHFNNSETYLPQPLGEFVDDFEDGDLLSRDLCNPWEAPFSLGCGSTSGTWANVADGAVGVNNLNWTGIVNGCQLESYGYLGWVFGRISLPDGNVSAATFKNMRIWVKGTWGTFTPGGQGINFRIYTADGDDFQTDLLPFITGSWTLVDFDLTTFVPGGGNPVHSDFLSEDTLITGIAINPWGYSDVQFTTQAFDFSFDHIEFY